MLSERAKKYLATLEREPAIIDEEKITAALEEAKIPIFEPIVKFQMEYGGYVEWYGFNDFHWGILHHKPEPDSFLEPNEIDFYVEDGEYYITCANCHRSDTWTLDSKGALYWCGFFKASSFEKKLERDAFATELDLLGKVNRIRFDAPEEDVVRILVPRLQNKIIAEASDEYQALYLEDNLYVAVDFKDNAIMAYIIGDETPVILKDISFRNWL